MGFKIGGEFGISANLLQLPPIDYRFSYKKNYYTFFDTGRSALYVALLEIIKRGGIREAWLPRYCCESVLLPFKALGFHLNYYSMGADLRTPAGLPRHLSGETFLFIHYFGKKNTAIIDWLNDIRNPCSFFVIEDCVQASLSNNVGNFGNYSITSFRKFLPQPDGALLYSDFPIEFKPEEPNEAFISGKLVAKILIESDANEELFLELISKTEDLIDYKINPRSISWLSRFLFDRTDLEKIGNIRRGNWDYLTGLLKDQGLSANLLVPIFDSMEEGEVPLGLPVRIMSGSRDSLRKFLFSCNIFCPIHWQLPEAELGGECEPEINLSRSILTLPVDQRLGQPELVYMVSRILSFYKSNNHTNHAS
jgi:hypothetical protein